MTDEQASLICYVIGGLEGISGSVRTKKQIQKTADFLATRLREGFPELLVQKTSIT